MRDRQVRPCHQVTQLPLHPLLVAAGQAGVQPDGEQLAPVDRAGVGQAGGLPGLEGLPGELGRGREVAGERGQGRAPGQGGQPDGRLAQRIGQPVELGQDPLRGGPVAEFEQVGQAQDAAVEFGLGFAGPPGRGDDLAGRGERIGGVLGTPQDVLPGGQRGGEGGGGRATIRIAGSGSRVTASRASCTACSAAARAAAGSATSVIASRARVRARSAWSAGSSAAAASRSSAVTVSAGALKSRC